MDTLLPEVITIEDAVVTDFSAIQVIYAYYVINTTVSFEEIPPSVEEMMNRWKNSADNGLPYLVARVDGKVAGYAYAFPYRPRAAYRYTIEQSIYISKDYRGSGIGNRLMTELIKQCQIKGYRQMLGVVAGTDNTASINFHKSFGFKHVGLLEKFGYKFDKWVDILLMQKEL